MKTTSIKLNDGRLIGLAEFGDPNGVPVFYFHGFPGSRLEASHFHAIAIANKYRIIGIDRPGMGLSSADKQRSILSWAKDVANLADYLGIEKFAVIGHSGGAAFVAACAYAIPQRLSGASIVSGMAPFENHESHNGMTRGQVIALKLIKAAPWFAPVMMKLTLLMLKSPQKMMAQMVKQLPEADKVFFRDEETRAIIVNSTIEAFKNGVGGASKEMSLLVNAWRFRLEEITCPVTIWQGTMDTQVPISHAKIYASLIPNASLNIIENEGHHSLIRNQAKKILEALCPTN